MSSNAYRKYEHILADGAAVLEYIENITLIIRFININFDKVCNKSFVILVLCGRLTVCSYQHWHTVNVIVEILSKTWTEYLT